MPGDAELQRIFSAIATGALRTLAPDLEVFAPVRDRAFKRPEQLAFLEQRGLPVPPYGAAYSVNRGLWGVTIGGKETLTSAGSIPEEAWVLTRDAFTQPKAAERHTIGFNEGVPCSLDGVSMDPVALIEALEALAAPFGIGRGIHLGDTVIGTKGRVAFEAPAAEVLIGAHRELEKLVLTGRQVRIKELVAAPYGDLVHEGHHLGRDPQQCRQDEQQPPQVHPRSVDSPGRIRRRTAAVRSRTPHRVTCHSASAVGRGPGSSPASVSRRAGAAAMGPRIRIEPT